MLTNQEVSYYIFVLNCVCACVCCVCVLHIEILNLIGASLSEPHTSKSDGTSDRLRTITIKHGKVVYSSIDNLNYTENSRNGLLTIYLTEMAH